MGREALKVNEVAKKLADANFTEAQAAAWFRKLSGDVFPKVGEIGTGAKNHGLYDPLVPAAATIVRALWEMGAQDRTLLRHVYNGLTEDSSNAPGSSWIGHILACATTYPLDSDLPALVVTQVFDTEDESVLWQVDVLDSVKTQIELSETQHPFVSIRVHCGIALRRFVQKPGSD